MAQKVFIQTYDLTQKFDDLGDIVNLPTVAAVKAFIETYVDGGGKSLPQKFIEKVIAHVATLSGVTIQQIGLPSIQFDTPGADPTKAIISHQKLEVRYGPDPLKMPTGLQADGVIVALTTGGEHLGEEWNQASLDEYGAASAVTLESAGGNELSRTFVDDGT